MRAMEAKQVDRSKKYNKRNFFSIPRPTLRIRRILKMPEVSGKVLRIIMVRILLNTYLLNECLPSAEQLPLGDPPRATTDKI